MDHDVDAIDVQAAGGNVGCNEYRNVPIGEPLEGLFALVLGKVTVDRGGGNAEILEVTGEAIGTGLRA